MINLAGVKDCDEIVCDELERANIPIVNINETLNLEVPTKYIGILNGFLFIRGWSYWIVKGNMPIKYAIEMYNKYKNLCIRAGGCCENLNPEDICASIEYREKLYGILEVTHDMKVNEALKYISNHPFKVEETDEKIIELYHVGTQEGLCKLAETIIKNNINKKFANNESIKIIEVGN